jgi:hypothetical protein
MIGIMVGIVAAMRVADEFDLGRLMDLILALFLLIVPGLRTSY